MNDELQMTNGGKNLWLITLVHSSFAFLNSIRWRLQIWYSLILVAVLTGFGATALQTHAGAGVWAGGR